MAVVFIILGAVMVLHGAGKLTDGACALARRMGVPQIVVGLTVVALGTSMPEFFVSLVSALKGTPDLAVGNVVGSNIFNTMLTVGMAAAVSPIVVSRSTVKKDIPFGIGAAVVFVLLCLDGDVSRLDGLILFAGFILFMVYTLLMAGKGAAIDEETQGETSSSVSIFKSLLFVFIGLAELVIGGDIFVVGATDAARYLGIGEGVIGLTIVAGGTSLPELATTLVAARKKQAAIAIGNVIGSNVFNILMIAGVTSLISPLHIEGITMTDMSVMLFGAALLWFMSYTKYTVERWEGILLVALFTAYMAWLVYTLP